MKKLSSDEVRIFIKENKCELLSEYVNSRSKLRIKCACGVIFETTFKEFKYHSKRQCNKCGLQISKSKQSNSYEKIKNIVDKSKSALITTKEEYEKNYINSTTSKVKIKCECGNEFETIVNKLITRNKVKCNKCSFNNRGALKRTDFKEIDKFMKDNDLKLISEFKNKHQKLKLICGKCGNEFYTSFISLQNSQYKCCKKCSSKIGAQKRKLDFEYVKEYIEKDNEYKLISDKYINNRGKIKILHAKCGRVFDTNFDKFKSGNRCPKCSYSKGEDIIEKWLTENRINHKCQYTFEDLKGLRGGKLRFDFAILDKNNNLKMLLEYDGELHYMPYHKIDGAINKMKTTQAHDKLKDEYCKFNNIKLLRIPYTQKDNIKTILENAIK